MDTLHREVDPLLGTSTHTHCMKSVALKVVLAVGLLAMVIIALTQTSLGIAMAANFTSCPPTVTTTSNSSRPVVPVRLNLAVPGAMIIPGGLFNLMLAAAAILLITCCRGWIKGYPNLCCFVAIFVSLVVYMFYTVSALVILLVQGCRDVRLFLAVMTANLLLGTLAITTGPYLLYCLLVSKKHMENKIEPSNYT